MQITKQANTNECGVCVINSLTQHYYKFDDKRQVLNVANISNNGLSIYDFENLAQYFGLFAESFQLEWKEFVELNTNEYLVCLLKRNNGLHYVIIKKHKQYITVYDSDKGKYQQSLELFAKDFAGILIFISKTKIKSTLPKRSVIDLCKGIDIKFLTLSLLLQICIIGLTTIGANLLNILINQTIPSNSIKNGIYVGIIFLLIYLMNGLVKYILNLYSTKYFKINFQYLSNILLQKLSIKRKSFFHKIDKNYFYIIDTAMQSVNNFIVMELPCLFSNIILLVVTTCVIATISPLILIVNCIAFLLNIGFTILQYRNRKRLFKLGLSNQCTNNNITNNYIAYIQTQNNYLVKNMLQDNLQNNYSLFQKIYVEQSKFNNILSFVEGLANDFLYVILVMIGCFLIINNQKLNIGQLTFLISVVGMTTHAFNKICDFPIKKIEYSQMSNIYLDFIEIDNLDMNGNLIIEKVEKIKFQNKRKDISINNGEHLKNDDFLCSLCNFSDQVWVNDYNLSKISKKSLIETIFVINEQTKIPTNWILQNIDKNNSLIIEFISKFNLNISSNYLTIQQQSLLNILASMMIKNKLIIFNNIYCYLNNECLDWIKTKIIPYIKQNNYLVVID